MGHDKNQRPGLGDAGFADTVLSQPPGSIAEAGDAVPGGAADAASGAGFSKGSEAGSDSDLGGDVGIDPGADAGPEADRLDEQPTLSHIGRYALKRQIGEGGLGRVYEAWDPLLSRAVAVKTLHFDLDMPSRIALDRILLNEARAAANLNHAHIVTVFDAGLSDTGVYIAMERLRGRDLRQALADGWRPTPAVAAQIVRRVADALAYAHARGLVHCDIKPANIFLTRKNRPKVLDFGIARAASSAAVPGAREATIAGSPHYLAPEQLTGGAIDARTDLHALGVVLYELLTGRKAFPGDSLAVIHAAVLEGTPPQVHDLCPEVPPALSAIVARAMARDPAYRYASAGELAAALRHWGGQGSPPAAEADASPAEAGVRTWRAALGAFAVAGLAAASVAFVLWPWGSAPVVHDPAARAVPASAVLAGPPAASPAIGSVVDASPAQVPAADPIAAAAAAPPPDSSAARPASKPAAARRPSVNPATPSAALPDAPAATGMVQLAVSPWGEVEVNGQSAGTTPPLTQLKLPAGAHQITVRNADFTPYTVMVDVQSDRQVTVRHRFGS